MPSAYAWAAERNRTKGLRSSIEPHRKWFPYEEGYLTSPTMGTTSMTLCCASAKDKTGVKKYKKYKKYEKRKIVRPTGLTTWV